MESIKGMLTKEQYEGLIRQIPIEGMEICDLSVDKLGYVLGYVAACTGVGNQDRQRSSSSQCQVRNGRMAAKHPAGKRSHSELLYAECSCCGARHYGTDGSQKRMLRDLADRGWKLYDDGGALCPECVAAVRATREGH